MGYIDSESLVQKASYLRIQARSLAEGMKTGNFRSLYRGQGIEFSGVRDYIRGDDIRCPVGAVFFDGRIHFSCKPAFGKERTMLLLTHLDKLPEQKTNGSVLGNALIGADKLLRKRSLIFVISDFRSADWQTPLIQLAQKNDVIAFRITDEFDRDLPPLGTVTFSDIESDLKLVLPTSSQKFKEEWKNHNEGMIWRWQEVCSRHGIHPYVMNVSDDPLELLGSVFEAAR